MLQAKLQSQTLTKPAKSVNNGGAGNLEMILSEQKIVWPKQHTKMDKRRRMGNWTQS